MTSPNTPRKNPEQNPEALKESVRQSTAMDLREYALSLNLEKEIPKNSGVLNVKDGTYSPAKNAE